MARVQQSLALLQSHAHYVSLCIIHNILVIVRPSDSDLSQSLLVVAMGPLLASAGVRLGGVYSRH